MRLPLSYSNWLNTLSFKPILFLGIAGTSSVATVLSAGSKEPLSKVKEIKDTVSKPLIPVVQKVSKGTNKLAETLGDWSKTMANKKDALIKVINETTKINTIPDGSRKIFSELQKWGKELYELLKGIIPKLTDLKSIQSSINKYGTMFKDILNYLSKAGLGGNELLIKQLFNAAGKENFSDFVSATSELASKHPDVLENMKGEDVENFVHAYNNNPEKTTEIIKDLAQKPDGKATTEALNNALKPFALEERVKQAIEKANNFISKNKIETNEQQEAKKALEDLKKLLEEVKQTLATAKK